MEIGQIITDGSTKWVVQDIRDTALVGQIEYHYVLRKGRVKANGALLNRAEYPMLWDYVNQNSLAISEGEWTSNQVMFSAGDGATTFRIPNLLHRTIYGNEKVSDIAAGLPDIEGVLYARTATNDGDIFLKITEESTGAFTGGGNDGIKKWDGARHGALPMQFNDNTKIQEINFKASNSNPIYGNSDTVQPPAIGLIPQIKYC